MRGELEIFVSVCGFTVDASFYSSFGIPGCLGVQKWDRPVFFFFYCKSDVLVVGVKMRVELCTIFMSDTDMYTDIREPNTINEYIYIPDIYKALDNPKWRFPQLF